VNLKHIIKTYEERNNCVAELEKKLKYQQIKFDKNMNDIQSNYKDKLKNRKIIKLEENKMDNNNNNSNNTSYIESKLGKEVKKDINFGMKLASHRNASVLVKSKSVIQKIKIAKMSSIS